MRANRRSRSGVCDGKSSFGGIAVKVKYPAIGRFTGILAFNEKGCKARGRCKIIDKASGSSEVNLGRSAPDTTPAGP
jgi:hypothetical protein